jgi:hypothetical protein
LPPLTLEVKGLQNTHRRLGSVARPHKRPKRRAPCLLAKGLPALARSDWPNALKCSLLVPSDPTCGGQSREIGILGDWRDERD